MNTKQLVQSYYQLVDAGEYSALYKLFSDDIVYQRCEQTISGMAAFKDFYEKDRTIQGKHTIIQIIASDEGVAVRGTFSGTNANQQAVELSFSDFFTINNQHKITHRYTYLAAGYQATT